MGYEAFVITDAARDMLAEIFPPMYPNWVGHHVTHRFGVPRDEMYPYGHLVRAVDGECEVGTYGVNVIGQTWEDGIEVLVCTVNGWSERPDGRTYHITWSLDPEAGFKPVDSNRVIAERGTMSHVPAIPIDTTFEYIE